MNDAAAEARAIFKTIDTDGDGALSSSELSCRLSDFGLGDDEILALFVRLDTDGDGCIDEAEWIAGFESYKAIAGGSAAEATVSSRNARVQQLEVEVLAALVAARSDPRACAERIRRRLSLFKGKDYHTAPAPGGDVPPVKVTKEGKAAVEDALQYLSAATPQPGFGERQITGLQLAAADHVHDVGGVGTCSHDGSDDSHHNQRQERYGSWSGLCGECLWYGRVSEAAWVSGETIIDDLIVDDGVASRGHRLCIFEPRYSVAGVALGRHAVFGDMVAIEFAAAYENDDGKIAARMQGGPPRIPCAATPAGAATSGVRSKKAATPQKTQWKLGACAGCAKEIRGGSVVEFGGTKYHHDCFKCSSCAVSLAGPKIEKRLEGGKCYCNGCWADQFAQSCSSCGKKLVGKYMKKGGKLYCNQTCGGQTSSGGSKKQAATARKSKGSKAGPKAATKGVKGSKGAAPTFGSAKTTMGGMADLYGAMG